MKVSEARVVVLTANLYQEIEFWYPVMRFRELGARVTIASMATGETYGSKLGYPVQADIAVDDIDPAQFDVLVIPGGLAPGGPAHQRGHARPGPQGVRAGQGRRRDLPRAVGAGVGGVIQGRRVTCVGPVRDDVINGGGN